MLRLREHRPGVPYRWIRQRLQQLNRDWLAHHPPEGAQQFPAVGVLALQMLTQPGRTVDGVGEPDLYRVLARGERTCRDSYAGSHHPTIELPFEFVTLITPQDSGRITSLPP